MPIHIEELDSSARGENITLILGKNILLKIIEDSNKQMLLKSNMAKKFVSIPNLCNDDVRLLINNLMEQEAYLTAPTFVQALVRDREKIEKLTPLLASFDRAMKPMKESKFFKAVEKKTTEENAFLKGLLKQEDLLSDLMLRFGKLDKKQLQKHEKKLLSINKKIEDKTGFKALVPSTVFVCPKDKIILGSPKIAIKKCPVCNIDISEGNVERIPIYKISEEIKNVWQSNLWFEAYFTGLLRRLGCKTWTSVHVMGASGILHEVDVLAIRKGTILVSECKTGKVSRNDVFNFCTKVGDIKAHISILALINKLPERETREFVKKNPSIIRLENMGKTSEADILTELKQRLSIKT